MKQSIQKHDISNLSPLAPALRGLEDARTQRWTFCEPCSMEQNVQVQGEHCQHGKTIKHVWENAKMPKHRASKATVLTMSMDWEPHAKPDRWTQRKWFMTNSLSKKDACKHNRNGQHSEAARSMKWAVVDMFAKSEFGTREICSRENRLSATLQPPDRPGPHFWTRSCQSSPGARHTWVRVQITSLTNIECRRGWGKIGSA